MAPNKRYTLMCRDQCLGSYSRRIRAIAAAGRYAAERLRNKQTCIMWIRDEGTNRILPRQLQLEVVPPEDLNPTHFCLVLRNGEEVLQAYRFDYSGTARRKG